MRMAVRGLIKQCGIGALGALLIFPLAVSAVEDAQDSQDALQALLGALEQETKIATRTKMNIDFVPGMVSVLYGEDLLSRGVRDASEALELIPGIERSVSNDGTDLIFVRGIGSVFASGKIKVLLNGIAFNSTLTVASSALAIPVEQIERIEVIRGPGSTIYGEFAYSGVVNVITRKKQDQVFVRYGDLGQKMLGGILTHGNPGENWFTSLSFSATNIDGDGVKTGPDVLRGFPASGVTRAPGETNEKEIDRVLILHTQYQNFDFSMQWSTVKSGDYFGLGNALSGNGQKLIRDVDMLATDIGWNFSIGNDTNGKISAGVLDYKLYSGLHQLYPPGFFRPGFGAPSDFPQGVLASPNHEERKRHIGVEVNYTGISKHEILLGVNWYNTKQGDVFAKRNYDPITFAPVPLAEYRGSGNWLGENLQRRLWAVFMQDQFSANEQLTLTAGIRFDSYDDVGHAASPRVSAVYRLSGKQTLKLQYARAFRPPTFLELSSRNNPVVSGNPNIESETIDNYEFGFIYNDGVSISRATLFYADSHDLIIVDTSAIPSTYVNKGEVHVYGAELEYSRNLNRKLKVDGNLTLQTTKDEDNNRPVADVANVLANIGVAYQAGSRVSVVGQYRFVGDRQRAQNDVRDNLDSYQTVDVVVTVRRMFASTTLKNVTMRGGVRNLFDDDVIKSSPLTNFGGSVIATYPQDYPRPGREYWLQMNVQF